MLRLFSSRLKPPIFLPKSKIKNRKSKIPTPLIHSLRPLNFP